MIIEANILGRLDNPVKVQMRKGYYIPSDSDVGISLEMIGEIHYPLESRRWEQKISTRKPRCKFYLEVTFTVYKMNPSSHDLVTRTEYRLPNGELVYVGDCEEHNTPCSRKRFLRAFELFKQYSKSKRLNEEPLKVLYKRDLNEDSCAKSLSNIDQLRKKKSTKPKQKRCSYKKK